MSNPNLLIFHMFIEKVAVFLETLVGMIWNWPVIILCLFSGIFLTWRLGGIQFRCLSHAVALISGKYDDPNEHGQITHFQALAAALSGTIGLGNIAGVAIAIGTGGPGAVFWMWIVALLGMATKFVECTLGTHYRDEDPETGDVRGGPMHYITKGLGKRWKPMAIFYGICIFMGAFGAGNMFQSNQAANALANSFSVPIHLSGIALMLLVGFVIIGGIQRIGQVASRIVPFMCVTYILAALLICVINMSLLPDVIATIFIDAFTGQAAAGGALGAVIIWGVRRAVFSNEAGLGSAAIAHAAVKTHYPVREGIVAALGPLIDTIIVCTATAVVILLGGNFGASEMYGVVTNTVSYEDERVLPIGWSVLSGNDVPKNNDLRHFVDGDASLYLNASNGLLPYTMAAFDLSSDIQGLRFSYFKQSGDVIVTILNSVGTVIGSVDLDRETATEGLSVDGYLVEGLWNSIVINFSPELLSQISEDVGAGIALQIQPKSPDTMWFFDRVQGVGKQQSGITLTTASFDKFFQGFGSIFISLSVFFFAFSTLVTWYYYGETAVKYVFNDSAAKIYKVVFVLFVYVGAVNSLDLVLNFSDIMIGLMVIPNVIALMLLSGKVREWTRVYFEQLRAGELETFK